MLPQLIIYSESPKYSLIIVAYYHLTIIYLLYYIVNYEVSG